MQFPQEGSQLGGHFCQGLLILNRLKARVPQWLTLYFVVAHVDFADGYCIPGKVNRAGDRKGKRALEQFKQVYFPPQGYQTTLELRKTKDELVIDDQQIIVLTLVTVERDVMN